MSEQNPPRQTAMTTPNRGVYASQRNREHRGIGAAMFGAGITVGVAAGLIAVAVISNASPAKAFGLDDITGAAKKVGKGVVENARDLGAATKRDVKKIGGRLKGVGQGAVEKARDLGTATKRDARKIGGHVKDGVSAAYDHNIIRSAVAPNLLSPVTLGMGLCGLGNVGKLGCEFKPPLAPQPTPQAPETGLGSWGGPPRNPGGFIDPTRAVVNKPRIARKGPVPAGLAPAEKSVANERGNEVVPIKRGGRRNEVVPIRRGDHAPVQGIRKENLKPGHGRGARDKIARDRSAWGRPVGSKRPRIPAQPKIRRIVRDHRPDARAPKRIVRDHRVKRERTPVRVRDHRRAPRPTRRHATTTAHRAVAQSDRPAGCRTDRRTSQVGRAGNLGAAIAVLAAGTNREGHFCLEPLPDYAVPGFGRGRQPDV